MKPALVLWDWNGTLLNDVTLCVNALNRLLQRHGYEQQYDHARYREIFGFPIEEYYRRAGFDFEKHPFPLLAERYMDDYIPASDACPLAKDAVETLELFQKAGVRQVILSASPVTTLEHQVRERGVRPYFDCLLGLGDIYAESKVELGLDYLHKTGFEPTQTVMIGDSAHDDEVARALGVRCVLQASGHQNAETLKATGAAVVPGLKEAAALILSDSF